MNLSWTYNKKSPEHAVPGYIGILRPKSSLSAISFARNHHDPSVQNPMPDFDVSSSLDGMLGRSFALRVQRLYFLFNSKLLLL